MISNPGFEPVVEEPVVEEPVVEEPVVEEAEEVEEVEVEVEEPVVEEVEEDPRFNELKDFLTTFYTINKKKFIIIINEILSPEDKQYLLTL